MLKLAWDSVKLIFTFSIFLCEKLSCFVQHIKVSHILDEVPSEQLGLQNLSEDSTARQTVVETSNLFIFRQFRQSAPLAMHPSMRVSQLIRILTVTVFLTKPPSFSGCCELFHANVRHFKGCLLMMLKLKLDRRSMRSSPRHGLNPPYRFTFDKFSFAPT